MYLSSCIIHKTNLHRFVNHSFDDSSIACDDPRNLISDDLESNCIRVLNPTYLKGIELLHNKSSIIF